MESLFREESRNRLGVRKRRDRYLSTPAPFSWLLLVAALILLASFIVWGFTGSIPLAVSGKGYSKDSDRYGQLFIQPELMRKRDIREGDTVHIIFPDAEQIDGKVVRVSSYPISTNEMRETYGYNDWVISVLAPPEASYHYVVDMLFEGQVIEDTLSPIEYYLFGNRRQGG